MGFHLRVAFGVLGCALALHCVLWIYRSSIAAVTERSGRRARKGPVKGMMHFVNNTANFRSYNINQYIVVSLDKNTEV